MQLVAQQEVAMTVTLPEGDDLPVRAGSNPFYEGFTRL